MSGSWAEVLDLYGRALLDFEQGMAAGGAAGPAFDFTLPADLGPLPPELAGVASAVAELAARVEAGVRDAMAETAREQAAVSRARARMSKERPRAKFVDVEG